MNLPTPIRLNRAPAPLAAEGRAVLMASHDMGECEAISDQVVLLRSGRVLACEAPSRLGQVFAVNDALDFQDADGKAEALLRNVAGLASIHVSPRANGARRATFTTAEGAALGFSRLVAEGLGGAQIVKATLEEIYLSVYGSSTDVAQRSAAEK